MKIALDSSGSGGSANVDMAGSLVHANEAHEQETGIDIINARIHALELRLSAAPSSNHTGKWFQVVIPCMMTGIFILQVALFTRK